MLGKIKITGFYPTVPVVLSAPQAPVNRMLSAGTEGEVVGVDENTNIFLRIGNVVCITDPTQLEMVDTFDEVPVISATTH